MKRVGNVMIYYLTIISITRKRDRTSASCVIASQDPAVSDGLGEFGRDNKRR